MMHAASREAALALGGRTETLSAAADTETLVALSEQLASVARLLGHQPRLRRALADPTTDASGRTELAARLLAGKISDLGVQVVEAAVGQRWSSGWDLVDSIEAAGNQVLFVAADHAGDLDQVEDELFRFERILDASDDLAALLDEASADDSRRTGLLNTLISGKVHLITGTLLAHAVTSARKRSVALAIDDLLEAAAVRRERSVARVTTAVELTAAQLERLGSVLSTMYERPISVRTAIDPSVRGGAVVRVGDEVIDGSVATQLLRARKALAG